MGHYPYSTIPILTVFLVVLEISCPTAEIYTWRDNQGILHFSNTTLPEHREPVLIKQEINPKSYYGKYKSNKIRNRFKVLKIYDGDSIKVIGQDIAFIVRLAGIDAPETRKKHLPAQPFSNESKTFLSRLIKGKTIALKSYGIEAYNRQLAEVFVNGINVNLEMLAAGMAEIYTGKSPRGMDISAYTKAQANAKDKYKGIWTLGTAYQSPAFWRKMHADKSKPTKIQ